MFLDNLPIVNGSGGATEPYREDTINDSGILTASILHGYTIIPTKFYYEQGNFINCTLNNGVTTILSHAFDSCESLALTSLPSSITTIGQYAFYLCSNLALTSLPENIISIDKAAFGYCLSLTSLTFESIPIIESNIFLGCTNLITINVPWAEGEVANAPWGATNATINYNYTGV